ncbi:MAG: PspA/IM30 family protein [Leptolyngbyaceae cyanobacterium]
MGWLSRLSISIRTQIHDWSKGSDDPEERLDQIITDMQMELIQLRQAVAQAIATQKRTERQRLQHQTWAVEWYNRANLALVKGEEERAREALKQRQSYLVLMTKAEQFLQQQQQIISQLKANLRTLEQHIAEARTRRDLYKARSRSAEASHRLQTLIIEMSAQNTSMFEAIEERIMDAEAQAAALIDLNSIHSVGLPSQGTDNTQASIDAELGAMQAHLGQERLSQ